MNFVRPEIDFIRQQLREASNTVAQLESKLKCLKKFEQEEKAREQVLAHMPKCGYCIFDPTGRPELWTVRETEKAVFNRWGEFKNRNWGYYKALGYTYGPCIVKPIIRA